jgi:hypothetical protein
MMSYAYDEASLRIFGGKDNVTCFGAQITF